MIKVNYDINGRILGFYPDDITYQIIPEPFIEISDDLYKQILSNQDIYRIIDSQVKDVSNESDYVLENSIRQNNLKINNYKSEIKEIEIAQQRAIRELLLYGSDDAKNRLLEQENKIIEIRTKMQQIQL